jgi:hypothetical protein
MPKREPHTEMLGAAGSRPARHRDQDFAVSIAFKHFGARITVRLAPPDLLAAVEDRLPQGRRNICGDAETDRSIGLNPIPGRQDEWMLSSDDTPVSELPSLPDALDRLESVINMAVATLSREKTFIHAGAVVWRGRAIVIPGRSLSGKTSLVCALVRAGAQYLSDEFAVLDRAGLVHPYPKPLGIRDLGGLQQRRVPLEDIGGHPSAAPAPIGQIVVTKFHPAARWQPKLLSPAAALFALLDNTVAARLRPRESLDTLTQAVTQAVSVVSCRGDATTIAAELLGNPWYSTHHQSAVDAKLRAAPIAEHKLTAQKERTLEG